MLLFIDSRINNLQDDIVKKMAYQVRRSGSMRVHVASQAWPQSSASLHPCTTPCVGDGLEPGSSNLLPHSLDT